PLSLHDALPIYSAYQSLIRSRSITHQQQDQNHADEWNQSRENHNRIEGMSAIGLAHIRKIADEFEGNDSPDACTGTAETADRCHGFAVVKVGWQHVRHGRERSEERRVGKECKWRGSRY